MMIKSSQRNLHKDCEGHNTVKSFNKTEHFEDFENCSTKFLSASNRQLWPEFLDQILVVALLLVDIPLKATVVRRKSHGH